jgi:hypothetical protein
MEQFKLFVRSVIGSCVARTKGMSPSRKHWALESGGAGRLILPE